MLHVTIASCGALWGRHVPVYTAFDAKDGRMNIELMGKYIVTPMLFWMRAMNLDPLELVISTDW
jgi:hypothetical protein